jgi:hypothetical protein
MFAVGTADWAAVDKKGYAAAAVDEREARTVAAVGGKRYRVTAWQGGEGQPWPTVMNKDQAFSAAKERSFF